ncbi:indole-3-acetaldehyde oxidase-like, partial [Elysia marginata]
MKTFAVDAPPHLNKALIDIEELDGNLCKKTGQTCAGTCHGRDQKTGKCDHQMSRPVYAVGANDVRWYTPTTLTMLLELLDKHREDKYRLVFGNTAFGVYSQYHPKLYKILIETRHIMDFYSIELGDKTLNLGANLTPQNLIDLFNQYRENPKMPYAGPFSDHMKLIGQQGVRNMACWAGNLILKNKNFQPGFPSDIYLCFESVAASLIIYDGKGTSSVVTIPEFLEMDMKGKVISGLSLPLYDTQDVFIRTYKISLRLQTHAVQTEKYLTGKNLADPSVIRGAFKILSQEVQPGPGFASPEYRKSLAISFFYKYILDVCKIRVSPEFLSGATGLLRTPIVGTQDFGTNPEMWPVSKPMPKRDAQYLTTGTTRYLDDLPTPSDQLAGVPVISTIGQGTIDTIDPTPALAIPGVVAFLQASDIPTGGVNNWRPKSLTHGKVQELLSSGPINYAGQAIGVIVAKTKGTGLKAAEAVKVTYKDVKPPIVTIEDAIKRKSFFPDPPAPKSVGDAKGAIASAPHRLTGSISCGDQFHFHLETQVVSCIKSDNGGMDVMATSQCLDGVQETVAQVLGIPESQVTVESKRIGGAYGGKISQTFMVAGMTALAAQVLNIPVKMRLNLPTNMKMCGKRAAYRLDYTIGLDNNGKLLGIDAKVYVDAGCNLIKFDGTWIFNWIDNAYFCPNWLVTFIPLRTNKAAPASCRGPGSTPAVFFMESMMDHVARFLGKDAVAVRLENLYENGQTTPRGMVLEYCTIREVVAQHVKEVAYAERQTKIDQFNRNNRWKKRGLALMPNMFGIEWKGKQFNTHVIIHHGDASVSVGHGGIDIGQGINTKVIQVCAYELGIPMEKIQVKKSSTTTNANSTTTGGSSTSELCCLGVIKACAILKKRMAPVKAKMDHPTWEQLVTKCYENMIDLTASYTTHETDSTKFHYNCYSAATVEAEIDVLTGQYQLRQMDMLYDCGQSMNPELDIGQAEGGFVMGLGYFLLEELKYSNDTGEIINASTWSYKPPLPKDLPMKFNFKFLRNQPNPIGVLGSKAVAEPALVMSAAALLAIKHAIESARADNGHSDYFAL